MPKYSWSEYNKTNAKLSSKLIRFNDLNEVNFIEDGLYNHIRDIFCLTILLNKKGGRKTKVLDYGSNLLALSNIKSKINTKLFDFSIYDPFYSKNYQSIKRPFKINFITNKDELNNKKFDILNFGSSLQYIENIESLKNDINFKFIDTILITHTPISLSKKYKSKQKNHKSLIQNIHTLRDIKKYFKKYGYNLIFKSRNNEKYIACERKLKKTFSLNLIFTKKNNLFL
tara:strand:+ start:997 stop:1680 length:684 start_codon:yes stop_codon:yes gene_type:complete